VIFREKTYRKCLEEDQALYDSLHGVAGQAESRAQMAPALSDERRDTGRRLCSGRGGGCRCGCGGGGGDQRWRLADGGRRASSHTGHHLTDHVARRPAAAHPHPPLQRLHQHTVVSGGGGDGGGGQCDAAVVVLCTRSGLDSPLLFM